MLFFYVFFFLFQFLNTYVPLLAPLNPYVFCLLFIVFGITGRINFINLKLLIILLLLVISFVIIYTFKFTFFKSFLVTAKAIQFNFGYLILIPGFSLMFGLFPKVKLQHVLSVTFWTITVELFFEFCLIRVLKISPAIFNHYPKVQHITLDEITGIYTADRLLGLAGNASVTGVMYTTSFILYLGHLFLKQDSRIEKRNWPIILSFLACFFMISSGSAFFAILLAGMVVWIQKPGRVLINTAIALLSVSLVLIFFNYISTVTDVFGNKFTTDYLMLLLASDEASGNLPELLRQMSIDYNWYNLIVGTYFYEWGNADAVVKTVDYFFVNLIYEFGILGAILFFYIITLGYSTIKEQTRISPVFLKFGFLVIIMGSLHYPVIAYMASQIFISALVAVSIRDKMLESIENQSVEKIELIS